ncbi:hypothetical protein, partial [Enterococcus larvae]|uniref:hypothetical protein n=1 Tax=Enterococcus larvae TaxID=2794352 RepID=UPI003F2C3307
YANQSQQKLNEAQAAIDKEYSTLQGLEKEIQALFDEKDSNFLAEGVTAEQIDALKIKITVADKNYSSVDVDLKKLDTAAFSKEKTTAEEQLKLASEKLAIQEDVNGLFSAKDKVAIKGSTVSKDLPIADKTDEKTVKSVKESIDESSDSTFDQTASELVAVAEGQLKQITTAKTATEKVYKEKVISTDSKLYDAAKKEVDKIKNAAAKQTLSDQLAKVKKAIDKLAADKKATEEKKQEEAAQAEQEQAASAAEVTSTQGATTDQGVSGAEAGQSYTDNAGASTDYYNYGAADQGYSGDTNNYASGTDQAAQPTTPATPSTPAAESGSGSGSGDSNHIVVNPEDIQGSEDHINGGTMEWWGW